MRLARLATSLLLFAVACTACSLFIRHAPENPLGIVTFAPPPFYQRWAEQALACAKHLKADNPTLDFTIVHDTIDVTQFVWAAVATEQGDGGFPCRIAGAPGSCIGRFDLPDTVLISSQLVTRPWVVKHELLHWRCRTRTSSKPSMGCPGVYANLVSAAPSVTTACDLKVYDTTCVKCGAYIETKATCGVPCHACGWRYPRGDCSDGA